MKTLQSTSSGRGSGYRGRGGRGGGRGRGGRGANDARFASRFTDPRFQLSSRMKSAPRGRRSPRDQVADAARGDERFAKHLQRQLHEREASEEESELDDASAEGSQEDDRSSTEHSQEHSDGADSHDGEEQSESAELSDDGEVAAWAPEDVDYIEPKHRLAIVNCDWDHVRAVDLYAILFNALPLSGQLANVCVYLSEFGKRMIALERQHGPDLWAKPDDGSEAPPDDAAQEAYPDVADEAESDGDDNEPPEDDGWHDDDPAMLQEQGEDGEYFSSGKYRKYEMDRMKYYYAIATFDSADTAAAVYHELDGMDIEASGVALDLRYVDDEETFEQPTSRADSIPPRFKPLSSFKSAALSNTRFRISWDQDDVFRHQSVQDSFTGTAEEDDLAAYLAPPDSDDDDTRDEHTGRTRAEEKQRVRRRYAALLQEVGGLQEDGDAPPNDSDDATGALSSSDEDDDSLNRFSDVEVESDEAGSDAPDSDAENDGEVMGEVEGTMDLDADSKAANLQRDVRMLKKRKEGDLATQAEAKYRQRRKEMKKAKKEMLIQERESERAALLSSKDEARKRLKKLIGTDDDGAVHLSGKERRKLHAKEVKKRLAEERVSRKQMRMASKLGVTHEAARARDTEEAEHAIESIDTRFQAKLLSDPRFQLDVAAKDRRVSDDVQALATVVAKARRVKRSGAGTQEAHTSPHPSKSGTVEKRHGSDVDNAVDFFLSKPNAKRPRHH